MATPYEHAGSECFRTGAHRMTQDPTESVEPTGIWMDLARWPTIVSNPFELIVDPPWVRAFPTRSPRIPRPPPLYSPRIQCQSPAQEEPPWSPKGDFGPPLSPGIDRSPPIRWDRLGSQGIRRAQCGLGRIKRHPSRSRAFRSHRSPAGWIAVLRYAPGSV